MRAVPVRVLRGGVERVACTVGMILADRRAWLDRIGADAIVDKLERNHVFGAGEGGVGRLLAAHHERDGDIVGRAVPDHRSARLDRILERDHGWQGLIVDRDQFGSVARLLQGFRHHKGDAVADRPHLAARQDRPKRAVAFGAAHVLRHDRHQASDLVGLGVGAGEHGENPRSRLGRRRIDSLDTRVGVRRHHQHAVALQRHVDVVDIAAAAGDEAGILEPGNRLTDTEFCHAFSPKNKPRKPRHMRRSRSLVLSSRSMIRKSG